MHAFHIDPCFIIWGKGQMQGKSCHGIITKRVAHAVEIDKEASCIFRYDAYCFPLKKDAIMNLK